MSLSPAELEKLASEIADRHISPSIRGCIFREENKALAADILAALRRAAGTWIPVGERLPELLPECYCCLVALTEPRRVAVATFRWHLKWWDCRGDTVYPTHWMPMPEGPKGLD
jgi:hypothetical protein